MDMDVTFFLRLDAGAGATLQWSGNETVAPTETLATVPAPWAAGLPISITSAGSQEYVNPAAPPVLIEIWTSPPAFKCARSDIDIPCPGEMDTWREATHKSLANTVGVRWGNFPNFNTLPGSNGDPMAVRWTGEFQAPFTGEMTFALASTGPSVLYIDGAEVVRSYRNIWRSWSHGSTPQGKQYVLQGRWYKFEVQAYEKSRGTGDKTFLGYKAPGKPEPNPVIVCFLCPLKHLPKQAR
jgi:hypothetical protein